MNTAPKYTPQYTLADYQQWEGDWELWDGIAVSMTPSPFGPHGKLLIRMGTALGSALDNAACDATVLGEIDWIVSNTTVLRPDLLVVCGDTPQRHVEQVPAVVVEILSESTRDRDLGVKRRLYEEHRVPWYLVVDPEASELAANRLDANHTYVPMPVSKKLTLEICDDCVLELAVDRLFR